MVLICEVAWEEDPFVGETPTSMTTVPLNWGPITPSGTPLDLWDVIASMPCGPDLPTDHGSPGIPTASRRVGNDDVGFTCMS